MQKVILDTNVLISSLIQRNHPYFIVYYYVLEEQIEICVSRELFEEYMNVLHRPKFTKYFDFLNSAENVLMQIEKKATWYNPSTKVDVIKDKDDNKILELAVESKAHYIITGNTNDFTMSEYKATKIVTPKEFWETCR